MSLASIVKRNAFVLVGVGVMYASIMIANGFEHRVTWVAATARIVTFVSIAALFVFGAMAMRAEKELERAIFLESSAFAFYATVGSALVFAGLDELGVLHRPSPWTFWSVGWITWCIARAVLIRRRT